MAYGLCAVALPQLAFFYAIDHLSVGVALMLEYLGLVLVVAWQCLLGRRLPQPPTVLGIVLALVGLALVLDVFGAVRIDGIGVAWGLLAAFGLASFYLMSGRSHETALPPLALAGSGLVVGALAFAVARSWPACCRWSSVRRRPSSPASRCRGGSRCWSSA